MDIHRFIDKWKATTLTERAAAQAHFLDLCRVLDEPAPADVDPSGEWYSFEKGATKTGGGQGWADVWKRGRFAWEYKRKGGDLEKALKQLQQYALALENPPLLIVSDIRSTIIHTNFTNTVHATYPIPIEALEDHRERQKLKWAFTEPERLKPGKTRDAVTNEAASKFADLALRLRSRGHDPQQVAHFMTQLLFGLFAEDIGLLPRELLTRTLEGSLNHPQDLPGVLTELFRKMAEGGFFGADRIPWFNGGIFQAESTQVLPLEPADIRLLFDAAKLDWSGIEPAIFGTLFERGLDPDKRGQRGEHYTDKGSILRITEPVIREPLLAEWRTVKAELEALHAKIDQTDTERKQKLDALSEQLDKAAAAKLNQTADRQINKARKAIYERYRAFLERLRSVVVLDPACGSGNFLYVGLQTLKDLEHQIMLEAETLGLKRPLVPQIGPEHVKGIEINPYAAELARVTVWIGEIQWMLTHGYNLNDNPVLKPLDQIECRDALLNEDGTEAHWPQADVIVGNPPFLGDKKMISELGEDLVIRLRAVYKGRVPGGADLVTYWFEKARALIETGQTQWAGLVATNSIRGGANRKVLARIRETGTIFNAWSDEPWINEGAAVRVSIVCFGGREKSVAVRLNGTEVEEIFSNLTAGETDLTACHRLKENRGVSFQGVTKSGPFDIKGDVARDWLRQPANPGGNHNKSVLRPIISGGELANRRADKWVVNFQAMEEEDAALYEMPYTHLRKEVYPFRQKSRQKRNREYWWQYERPRPEMWTKICSLTGCYIATPKLSRHRFFVFLDDAIIPDNLVIVIARDDLTTFGILESRLHRHWSLGTAAWLGAGNDPTYTPTTCFETFPFPQGLTPDIPADQYADDPRVQAIAEAARRLVELRDNWLNPREWVRREPEVVPGYPDRILPVDDKAAQELKKRTLTNLYNQRPAWLVHAHRQLDEAVAAAYGWPADIEDDEMLGRLLALNLERSAD